MIKELQNKYMQEKGNKMKYFWEYYSNNKDVVPVYKRKPFDNLKAKTHTSVHCAYFGDIVGIKRGYIGEKIEIYHPDENIQDLLKNMLYNSNMQTINSQTIEYSSVEGLSHRLCYTEDGVFKQKNIHGWQVLYEGDPLNPDKAFYFYNQGDKFFCNIYDDTKVYIWELISDKNKKSEYQYVEEKEHNFSSVPIVPFFNNSNAFSQCDASIGLMDEYDAVLSDSIAEIKDLRRALLKIKGDVFTEQDSDGNPIPITSTISQSSVLVFAPDVDGKSQGDAEYMSNNLDDAAITSTLDRLRALIYETSGSIDLKELSTAERVFSIKASLLRLENDSKTSESYLKMGLRRILKLWTDIVNITNRVNIDYQDFEITIGRRIPADDQLKVDMFIKLSSILNIEDALRLAGWEDAKELAERAQEVLLPDLGV
jgi:SPP1 family phage portal protein